MSTPPKERPKDSTPPHRVETADQLREEIDRGGTGDKVAFSDPAAAPLGTDDEAAGHPPRPEDVRRAAAAEAPRAEPAQHKSDPAGRLAQHRRSLWIALSVVAVLCLILFGV